MRPLHKAIHVEMLVRDNNFAVKVLLFLFPQFGHFLVYAFAREEHSLEVGRVTESLWPPDLALKVRLAIIRRVISGLDQLVLRVLHRHDVGDLEVLNSGLSGLLGVFVPVLFFHNVVKAGFGLPFGFVFQFLFHCDLVLIDERECEGEVLLGVGVEVAWVVRDVLA